LPCFSITTTDNRFNPGSRSRNTPARPPEQARLTGLLEFDEDERAIASAATQRVTDEITPSRKRVCGLKRDVGQQAGAGFARMG
jgi:hypothetical protein